MDDNNKKNNEKLQDSDKETSNELMDDTIVFRREPDASSGGGVKQNQSGRNQRPNPARPQNIPTDMQNTAKLQGGAVIRPLKPIQIKPVRRQGNRPRTQNPNQNQQNPSQSQTVSPSQNPSQNQTVSSSQNPRQDQPLSPSQNPRQSQPIMPPQNQTRGVNPKNVNNPNPAQNSRPAQNIKPQLPPSGTIRQNPTGPNQSVPPQRPVQSSLTPVNQPFPNHPQNNTHLPVVRSNTPKAQPRRNEFKDFEIDDATYRRTPEPPVSGNHIAHESATGALMSVVKAVIYIVCVIAISIPVSIFVINTANDIFAFVKDEKIIEVTIPEYATIDDVGDILGESGLIKYPWAFKLWSNIKENGKTPEFIAGTYEISTNLNYDYMRATLKKKTIRSTVRITIPEGYTVDEIINLFVSNGIGTYDGFVDAINNYNFDYPFLNELDVNENRFYRLEGYLFPDTYDFYTDSSEVLALAKLLDNFDKKFIAEYYQRCVDLGITVNEAITLASMIEKEAKYADELGDVSSVFHNRLKYKLDFPYLNSDATIMYAIQHDSGTRKDTMTGDDTKYDTPYNTYTYRGLPPGPISNPGLNAIKYALYPNNTEYFYFVSNSSGRMLFATTYSAHIANINTARGN